MREILFRGKRIDNGEWVYGAFCPKSCDDPFGPMLDKPSIIKLEGPCDGWWFDVDSSTIGQYTGLTDKNGKRIFEGDIVRFYERQLGGEDAPVIQSVGYEEGGFCVYRYFLNNWLRNAINGNIQLEGIEVIGTIHDNPELLKEEPT